jgi:hypothetical protein
MGFALKIVTFQELRNKKCSTADIPSVPTEQNWRIEDGWHLLARENISHHSVGSNKMKH